MLKKPDYKSAMKIGYGYNRTEHAFRSYGVHAVWIDTTPQRVELAYLMGVGGKDPAINPGEVLVLLQHADIGESWHARERVLKWLADRGCPVQVRHGEPILYDTEEKLKSFKAKNGGTKTQIDPGRPKGYKWPVEKAKEFAEDWYGPASRAMIEERYKEVTGRKFTEKARQGCIYLFGPRNGSRKTKYLVHIGEKQGD